MKFFFRLLWSLTGLGLSGASDVPAIPTLNSAPFREETRNTASHLPQGAHNRENHIFQGQSPDTWKPTWDLKEKLLFLVLFQSGSPEESRRAMKLVREVRGKGYQARAVCTNRDSEMRFAVEDLSVEDENKWNSTFLNTQKGLNGADSESLEVVGERGKSKEGTPSSQDQSPVGTFNGDPFKLPQLPFSYPVAKTKAGTHSVLPALHTFLNEPDRVPGGYFWEWFFVLDASTAKSVSWQWLSEEMQAFEAEQFMRARKKEQTLSKMEHEAGDFLFEAASKRAAAGHVDEADMEQNTFKFADGSEGLEGKLVVQRRGPPRIRQIPVLVADLKEGIWKGWNHDGKARTQRWLRKQYEDQTDIPFSYDNSLRSGEAEYDLQDLLSSGEDGVNRLEEMANEVKSSFKKKGSKKSKRSKSMSRKSKKLKRKALKAPSEDSEDEDEDFDLDSDEDSEDFEADEDEDDSDETDREKGESGEEDEEDLDSVVEKFEQDDGNSDAASEADGSDEEGEEGSQADSDDSDSDEEGEETDEDSDESSEEDSEESGEEATEESEEPLGSALEDMIEEGGIVHFPSTEELSDKELEDMDDDSDNPYSQANIDKRVARQGKNPGSVGGGDIYPPRKKDTFEARGKPQASRNPEFHPDHTRSIEYMRSQRIARLKPGEALSEEDEREIQKSAALAKKAEKKPIKTKSKKSKKKSKSKKRSKKGGKKGKKSKRIVKKGADKGNAVLTATPLDKAAALAKASERRAVRRGKTNPEAGERITGQEVTASREVQSGGIGVIAPHSQLHRINANAGREGK